MIRLYAAAVAGSTASAADDRSLPPARLLSAAFVAASSSSANARPTTDPFARFETPAAPDAAAASAAFSARCAAASASTRLGRLVADRFNAPCNRRNLAASARSPSRIPSSS